MLTGEDRTIRPALTRLKSAVIILHFWSINNPVLRGSRPEAVLPKLPILVSSKCKNKANSVFLYFWDCIWFDLNHIETFFLQNSLCFAFFRAENALRLINLTSLTWWYPWHCLTICYCHDGPISTFFNTSFFLTQICEGNCKISCFYNLCQNRGGFLLFWRFKKIKFKKNIFKNKNY